MKYDFGSSTACAVGAGRRVCGLRERRILMVRMKRTLALLFALCVLVVTVAPMAFGAAPGPGDKQCRGATGNNNPHCPPPS